MVSGGTNRSSMASGKPNEDTPPRIIMMHAVAQASSSGQSPSQHGSDDAEISAARPADASFVVAQSRVTTIRKARKDRTVAAILIA